MRTLPLLLILVFGSYGVWTQTPDGPPFGRYAAKVETRKAKAIDFANSPGAWSFRTRLREALRGGVNFAGHYILTGWGCGTGCIYGAIIDARNGRVYFPQPLAGLAVAYNDSGYEEEPVQYKKNSRLLVVHGTPGTGAEGRDDNGAGIYYYEWKNNRLQRLKIIEQVPN